MAYDESWINELMNAVDLAALVSEYTTLTPKGGRLWACCPFHKEKTPSFKLDTDTGLYYCFGCHKGGNAITFLSEIEGISKGEAIAKLADKVGMTPPDTKDTEQLRARKAYRDRLFAANRTAALFYHEQLKNNAEALDYLRRRGLHDSVIKRFGLGLSPNNSNELGNMLIKQGYTEKELLDVGLVRRNDYGLYDFFRGRIMFPIINESGRVLAFGGRVYGNSGDNQPKYINSGDTFVYNKRRNLYALNMCPKGTISDLILTEGYMDTIALHSVGINNAVASLGTALTEDQAKLIKRKTNRVFIAYDGDGAGQAATLRGMSILEQAGLEVRVIMLTDGLDPDDFCRRFGGEAFLSMKDNAMPLNAYRLENMSRNYDMNNSEDRSKYATAACKIVAKYPPVEREGYYDMISKKTGISLEAVKEQGALDEKRPSTQPSRAWNTERLIRNNREERVVTNDEHKKRELMIAACAYSDSGVAEYLVNECMDCVSSAAIRQFIELCHDKFKKGQKPSLSGLVNESTEDLSDIIGTIGSVSVGNDPIAAVKDCIRGVRRSRCEEELRRLSTAIDRNEITADEYAQKYRAIVEQMRKLG